MYPWTLTDLKADPSTGCYKPNPEGSAILNVSFLIQYHQLKHFGPNANAGGVIPAKAGIQSV